MLVNMCPLLSIHMLAMWFASSAPMHAVAANWPKTFSHPACPRHTLLYIRHDLLDGKKPSEPCKAPAM